MKIKLLGQDLNKSQATKLVREALINFDARNILWLDLLERHPNKKEKVGVGLDSFFVTYNRCNKNAIELNIKRVDGTVDHISWKKCIDAKDFSQIKKLKDAMRLEIMPQVQMLKDNIFKRNDVACELCKSTILNKQSCHVDHDTPTFDQLFDNFTKRRRNMSEITEFDSDPFSNASKFKKEHHYLSVEWKHYHLKNAKLRILCARCNLTRPKNAATIR